MEGRIKRQEFRQFHAKSGTNWLKRSVNSKYHWMIMLQGSNDFGNDGL